MTASADELVAAAVAAARVDYVGMDRLRTVVSSDLDVSDMPARFRRTASVLAALADDERVVVVGTDMLTPLANEGLEERFLEVLAAEGHVGDGDFAWVLSRESWERDRIRRSAETRDGSESD